MKELADRVEQVLSNRHGVLARQRAWMDRINAERGWDAVAQEYLNVIQRTV